MKTKRILFICLTGIGNVLFLFPVFQQLRNQGIHFDLACSIPGLEKIFNELYAPSNFIEIKNYGKTVCLPKPFLGYLMGGRQYDVGLFVSQPRYMHFLLRSLFNGCDWFGIYRHTPGRLDPIQKLNIDTNTHESQAIAELVCQVIGLNSVDKDTFLNGVKNYPKDVKSNGKTNAKLTNTVNIGVHAGSDKRSTSKRAHPELFAEFVQAFLTSGCKVHLFGTNEEEKENHFLSNMFSKYPNFHDHTNLLTLDNTLDKFHAIDGFISNDSGVGHLFAMTGKPQLCFFKNTNPARYSPLNSNARVLQLNDDGTKLIKGDVGYEASELLRNIDFD